MLHTDAVELSAQPLMGEGVVVPLDILSDMYNADVGRSIQ